MQKIPVIVLSGFLGSGKTTLINRILKQFSGKKIAIIENEFGKESIDSDLLEVTQERIVEISNGCLCCSVREDFIGALHALIDRAPDLDLCIIESSGASEPLPIIQTFGLPEVASILRLDSLWCLIDENNFEHSFVANLHLTREQIEYAHVLYINKGTPSEKRHTLIKHLRQINASAVVVNHEDTSSLHLLISEAFHPLKSEQTIPQETAKNASEHEHHHLKHFIYQSNRAFLVQKFRSLLDELPNTIYRIKGFVQFREAPNIWYLVQKVGYNITIEEWTRPIVDNECRLVIIGSDFREDLLSQEFHDCHGTPNPLFQK